MQPHYTPGLTGRKKAAEEFKNKLKYGAEGTLFGGGFPWMGKGLQLGYKWLGPKWALKTGARIGTRTVDKLQSFNLRLIFLPLHDLDFLKN